MRIDAIRNGKLRRKDCDGGSDGRWVGCHVWTLHEFGELSSRDD
jgi:hypothetical protein